MGKMPAAYSFRRLPLAHSVAQRVMALSIWSGEISTPLAAASGAVVILSADAIGWRWRGDRKHWAADAIIQAYVIAADDADRGFAKGLDSVPYSGR